MIIVRHDTHRAPARQPAGMMARLLPGFSPRFFPRLSPRLTAGLVTLLVWALLAGSTLAWWLRLGDLTAPLQAPPAVGPRAAQVDSALVAHALGGGAQTTAAPADDGVARRLALRGVVTHGGRGAALIAVDGKAALPVRVGEVLKQVDGGWRLQSVARHAAPPGADGREPTLEPPELARRSIAGDAVAPPSAAPPAAAPAIPGVGLPRPGTLLQRPGAAPAQPAAAPSHSARD